MSNQSAAVTIYHNPGCGTSRELGLGENHWTDAQLIDQMLAHPILINRPIVVTPGAVRLCRPSDEVLEILPPPQSGT